jgi:hypothetical protein
MPPCSSPFLYTTKIQASVAAVLRHGVHASLVPRLTVVVECQLYELLQSVATISLAPGPDTCSSVLPQEGGAQDVGALYRLAQLCGVVAPFASFVWDGFAPSKAKFFAWLLVQSRI